LRSAVAPSCLAVAQRLGRRLEIFLANGPAYVYRYGLWRWTRWRWRLRANTGLTDPAFYKRLQLDQPQLEATQRAAQRGDYAAANEQLWAHFKRRSTPRFFWAPEEADAIAALVGEEAQQVTLQRADEICNNVFQFRRAAPVRLATPIDWTHCPDGNVDWTWDLNRHQYFETLGRAYTYSGDERYARRFRDLLLDWLERNPPRSGQVNWASVFEVAFRINTWLWAFSYLRGASAFDAAAGRAFLEGLLRHGEVLDEQLELHAANNHLLLEAKALVMLGLAMPEFRQAHRWMKRGLRLLFQEVRTQVCADGVHGERVTHYQRAIAGELLEVLLLLENNGQSVPQDIEVILARMLEFEVSITKPDGLIPLFGDSGLDDSHIRFAAAAAGPAGVRRADLKRAGLALSEADVWLVGSARAQWYRTAPAVETALPSRSFPEGGYVVMRQGRGPGTSYLAMDAAPFGYRRVPGHGHADALSIELFACGETMLVDPGVYGTWAPAEWRNYFRSTRAHNTIVVDEQDQSLLVGIRHVHRPAQVTLHAWISTADFDLADASHNGYRRLAAPITHRRQVLFVKPQYWLIVDSLTGTGQHDFDLYFHCMPGATVSVNAETGAAQVCGTGGSRLFVAPVATVRWQPEVIVGAETPIQGWTALYSGEKQPAPVLRYRHSGPAPVQICTVLYPVSKGSPAPVTARPLEVTVGTEMVAYPSPLVTGVQVETQGQTDQVVLDRAPQPVRKSFAGMTGMGRVIIVRRSQSGPEIIKRVEQ
jgi:hypothetical protein